MSFSDKAKTLLTRESFQSFLLPLLNRFARWQGHGLRRIFPEDGVWMHETSRGYFAYHQPYLNLDLASLDEFAQHHFLWGYQPKPGDVIVDVGAGVGEETLTFARGVGERGKVICIEAHPRTYRCLEKLVQYNCLGNVVHMHVAVAEPGCPIVCIESSDEYLANRADASDGVAVSATTIDAIYRRLNLGRVNFLKMNIEGSERLAIHGMTQALRRTEIVCVSCHDFLAKRAHDDRLRTKAVVREFLRQNGFGVAERVGLGLPPYLRDQLWAYNPAFGQKPELQDETLLFAD